MTKLTLVDLTGRVQHLLVFLLTSLLNEYMNFILRIHGHLLAIVHLFRHQACHCELYTFVQIPNNNLKPVTIVFPQGSIDQGR